MSLVAPDACDLVLLVHLSLNNVATEVHSSKCGDRQSAFAHVTRDATACPSGHWSRVAAKATSPTHTREGLGLGGDTRPLLLLLLLFLLLLVALNRVNSGNQTSDTFSSLVFG